MHTEQVRKIFVDTAYVRTGGSDEELKAAEYIKALCAEMGLGEAVIEDFPVEMAAIKEATLTVDGNEIPCKGYFNCGSGEVTAPIYYLTNVEDKYQLSLCKDKIVLVDGYMRHWMYQDLLEAGMVGFVSYDGNVNYTDYDIDQRELRKPLRGEEDKKTLGVNINVKHATEIVNTKAKTATIKIEQDEWMGNSRNVVLDMPGESDEYIVFTAHYDSTSLSQGAYDNMSGSVGLLGIAEHFKTAPHKRGLKFVWCGSEERGLLGSKAYCEQHEEELGKVVLNINLDMIGCIMGKFISCCTTEEKLVHYIDYLSLETGFSVSSHQGVYSSDSTPFADKGVPALSFARISPPNAGTIHNSYDTMALMSDEQMLDDISFINYFSDRMANAVVCPVAREIPENMKEEIEYYNARKRKGKK